MNPINNLNLAAGARVVFVLLAWAAIFYFWGVAFSVRPTTTSDRTRADTISTRSIHVIDLNKTTSTTQHHRLLGPTSGYVTIGDENLVGGGFQDNFGSDVAVDATGSTIAVVSILGVQVYQYIDGNNAWEQKGQILQGQGISDSSWPLYTFLAMSDDGNIVAVSNSFEQWLKVFQFDGNWTQRGGNITRTDLLNFGRSISLNGDGQWLAVGAPGAEFSGWVGTYKWDGAEYVQSGASFGSSSSQPCNQLDDCFGFGFAVSLSRDIFSQLVSDIFDVSPFLAVGGSFAKAGEVQIYPAFLVEYDSTEITLRLGENLEDEFGYSVALNLDGGIIVIGIPGHDSSAPGVGGSLGKVQVFQRVDQRLTQLGSDLVGDAAGDEFGSSVDISDDGYTIVAGATSYARIYKYDGNNWILVEISRAQGFDIAGSNADGLGYAVAISGDGSKIIVGAPQLQTDEAIGYAQVWTQTQFPTFSPIKNPLPQIPGPPASLSSNTVGDDDNLQSTIVSSVWQWLQRGAAFVTHFFGSK